MAVRGPDRLDDVQDVALVGGLVEVGEVLAELAGVLGQVVVAPVGDALELVPPPREQELDVARGGRVVRQLVGVMRPQPQLVGGHAEAEVPVEPLLAPVLVPLRALGRRDEVLHLHLLELAGAEHEVPGVISLRNDLPIWAMPNGGRLRDVSSTFLKLRNMPCAVSGRR